MKKKLIIIDLSSFIFRAFYGVRMLNAPDGTPVNSLHGILGMFLKMISEFQPTHLILAKDTKGGSFRNEMYSEYKANRGEPPEELIPQFPLIGEMLDKMGIKSLAYDQYEADDIIGSLSLQWKDQFDEILLASSDKDLMQLIDGPIKMLDTMKSITYDRDGVFNKMGVYPEQIVDYLAMMGDASDNVPGMRGIGAKGAAKLLTEHKTLENCIENKDSFKGKKLTTAFSEYLDDGLLSKKLVTLKTDIKMDLNPEDTEYKFYPTDDLIDFLKNLGFKSAIKKLEDLRKIDSQVENEIEVDSAIDLEAALNIKKIKYTSLNEELKNISEIAIFSYLDKLAIATSDKDVLVVESDLSETISLLLSKEIRLVGCQMKEFIKNDLSNIKAIIHDVSLKQYMITHERKNDLETLVKKYFQKEVDFEKVSLNATFIFSINNIIDRLMIENEIEDVYTKIDEPIIKVLAQLEVNGIKCDISFLNDLEKEYQKSLEDLDSQIRSYTKNEELNINSTKQLAEFLFTELDLPPVKKTKTGFSTDAEVLETLVKKDLHPAPELIVRYRELNKLLSTYVKTLPELVSKVDKRIHPTFNIDGAATGRLSCTEPNLQNIPVRTKLGREIRKGFVTDNGKTLLGADYSQIELRLLAHMSEDKIMIDTFNNSGDIHLQTAAEILGKDPGEINKDERSSAKAINFGLMYGQGVFGLSKQLNITRSEAKAYIEKYFNRFSSIKSYLQSLKAFGHEHNYVETMYKRKRFLPQINSHNKMEQASSERVAINSPIQGTAADLIKIAMIEISKELKIRKLESKMLLQIHDELIFEVLNNELEEITDLVKTKMEGVIKLKVPLIVDINTGLSWYDLK